MSERPYANLQNRRHHHPSAFVGIEHEHTVAFGRTTLFIIGCRSPSDIRMLLDAAQEEVLRIMPRAEGISHISYGANWSFNGQEMNKWEESIEFALNEGFWCTLAFRPAHIPLVQMTGMCRHAHFIPLLCVRIPKVAALGPNAALKIDDISFNGTNAGVWCHSIHTLMHGDYFTPWSWYAEDQIIEFDSNSEY